MMGIVKKSIKFITNPIARMRFLSLHGFYKNIPEDEYLRRMFKLQTGCELDLNCPKTFNEKLQWLKLYDRKPEYTTMVDKYAAKKWVADRIGEEYIIPTLGVWEHFDDIDFEELPDRFVLKCTHDSGGLVIVKDKVHFDKSAAKKKLEKCLKRNYYWYGLEWPYKDVPPRIIAEKYMTDESGVELKDYKIFNFDGEPKLIQVDYNRFVEHKRNLYTIDWQYIEAAIQYPNDSTHKIDRPKQLEKMLDLARTLSAGIPHVRTDFYCIDDRVYFGELTFYHESGLGTFAPESFGEEMGKWLKLPGGGYILTGDGYVLWLHQSVSKNQDILLNQYDSSNNRMVEYKIFCFNGKAKIILVCKGEAHCSGRTNDYCDLNLKRFPFTALYPNSQGELERPIQMDHMIELAEKLAEGIPQVRVDMYLSDGNIYFGEMTFFHNSGCVPIEPEEWDIKLGSWIELPGRRP